MLLIISNGRIFAGIFLLLLWREIMSTFLIKTITGEKLNPSRLKRINEIEVQSFRGPQWFGESSLFEYLRNTRYIHTEIYVSADRIEAELLKKEKFVFKLTG
jgi:hypothetical protein